MKCLDAAAIARAVTHGADDPHFADCLDCRRRLEADRSARDALRVLPSPALTGAHRKALAAEIIATAQLHVRPRRRVRVYATAGSLAAAAALALVAAWPRARVPTIAAPTIESRELLAIEVTHVASDDAPPAMAAPGIAAARGTMFEHAVGRDRDIVTLVDGKLALDTTAARNVEVRVGDALIRVDNAAVEIRARKRTIVSVRVIVGTARVDTAEQRMTLQRDSVWLPGPSAQVRSLAAFRDAWLALRAGRNEEAMELFDRVTDPVALEEASYWAAIAARRAGDPSANERIEKFMRAFPESEYADEIRSAKR